MRKILLALGGGVAAFAIVLVAVFFVWPRPEDTTEARVFEGDSRLVDYCVVPVLEGLGPTSEQIPKAYTPGCGWSEFPMPVLAACREPLAAGVVDMRGLWLAHSGRVGHVERIEQCGDRTVVTSSGIIHDFRTDGTLKNGSRDIEPPLCNNTFVAIEFEGGVMNFYLLGIGRPIVTRRIEGEELVWTYPGIEGEVRMRRICKLPESQYRRNPETQRKST
jgi:hypothetical protein